MAKGIDKKAVVPVEATLLSLALCLTGLRLFLRLILQRTRLTASDWLLVASCANAIALLTTDTMAYNLGAMDDWDPEAPMPPESEQIALMKINFSGNYFYDTGIYIPKLALLAFYYRLVPHTMPKLRKFLYGITGLTVAFMTTTVFVDTFWCGLNVPVNWSLEEGTCKTYDSMTVTQIDWAMNLTADILIFAVPFPLLKGLKVNKRYMIGLIATFASGIITVAASVSRFATMQVIHAWTNVYVLSMAELVAAIVVVCLPSLKSLVSRTIESSSAKRSRNNTAGSSHIKLSSGRDRYANGVRGAASSRLDESGSEVELNNMKRTDVIYKSERISVTYQNRDDMGI